MDGDLLVTNIQRMCMSDGPGIRTTVFMKGCNLRCPWCANPENIHQFPERYCKDGRQGEYGRYYSPERLLHNIMKDRLYWEPEGGVTFSGGEPLLWARQLLTVMRGLKSEGVHIAVETALQIEKTLLEAAAEYVDLFIVDVKILQPEICRGVLGGNVQRYTENVELLKSKGKKLLFRIPCNREYTVQKDNFEAVKSFLRQYAEVPVEIFATHSLGKEKYRSLGLECREFEKISVEELTEIAEDLSRQGSRVTINTI